MPPPLHSPMSRFRGPAAAAILVALGILVGIRAARGPGRPERGPAGARTAPPAGPEAGRAAPPSTPPRAPTEARLRVTVTGLDGLAAPEVAVTLAGSGVWPPRSARTAEDGVVVFDEVPAGVYEVRAQTEEAIAEPYEGLELARGQVRDLFLALETGRAIMGRVVDAATGAPITGARVSCTEEALSAAPRVAASGADGTFSIEPVLERPHFVNVRADGYVARLGLSVTGGDPELSVALHRGATIRGRVVDARGFPVQGAQIEVLGIDVDGGPVDVSPFGSVVEHTGFSALLAGAVTLLPAGELGVTVGPLPPIPGTEREDAVPAMPAEIPAGLTTGPTGEFVVEAVPPGRVAVHAWHPQHARGVSRTLAVSEGATLPDVEVVLPDGARVAGRIVDEGGFPIRGATVEVRAEEEGLRVLVTGADGTFAFGGLQGIVTLRASAPEHEPEGLTIDAAQAAEIELALAGALPETPGRVVDDRGYPVAHATVRIVPLQVTADRAVVVSGADGTFAVRVPAAVPLAVEVRHPDHAVLTLPAVVPDPREGLHLTLGAAGGIEGTVRAARGGFPVAPFDLVIEGEDGAPVERRVDDLDGRFEQTGLSPGTYALRVSAEGFAPWEGAVEVSAPRGLERVTAPAIEVELAEVVELSGEVVDARGDPVAGARVRADRPVRLVLGRGARPVTSDAAGRFTLGGLSPRETTIFAVHAALGTARAVIDLGRGAVDDARIVYDAELGEAEAPAAPARFGGVAVVLEGARIAEVLAGSEARRAGLREGDVVTSVDGRPVSGGGAARALRGAPGTELIVGVSRRGTPRLLRVAREVLYR